MGNLHSIIFPPIKGKAVMKSISRSWDKWIVAVVLLVLILNLAIPLPLTVAADDGIGTWSKMNSGTTEWIMDIWGSSSSNVFNRG